MIEERLNILEAIISAIAFDRLNLQFMNEPNHKLNYNYGVHQIELVLNHFELPFCFFDWEAYHQIINNETIKYAEIIAFIKLIKHRSKVYLTKKTKRNLKQIKKALQNQWNFDQLRDKLSVDLSKENDTYYWFLYHEKLRKDCIRPEDFLADIALAEKLQIVANIAIHRNFVKTIEEHQMDSSKVDNSLLEIYYKLRYLFEFVDYGRLEKYEKIIRLKETFK